MCGDQMNSGNDMTTRGLSRRVQYISGPALQFKQVPAGEDKSKRRHGSNNVPFRARTWLTDCTGAVLVHRNLRVALDAELSYVD